jgi:integrase
MTSKRQRTGSVEPFVDATGAIYYRARIRLADGSRVRVDIPSRFSSTPEEREVWTEERQADEDKDGRLLVAKRKRAERAKPSTSTETVDGYREKLCELREAEGKRNVTNEQFIWRKWISPRIGSKLIASVTADEVENIRDELDEQVKERIAKGLGHGISGAHAMNVWSMLRTTFAEAVSSRDRSMRVRTTDPTDKIKAPLTSSPRKKTFVYPAEFAALMTCREVPLEWRRLYAVATYLYLRPGELRALTWADVDLDARVVHVTKAYDEAAGEVTRPKTANGVRDVPIEPALVPLLEAMKRGHAELVAPLLVDFNEKHRAIMFRDHLRAAKVKRPRLFDESTTTVQVNFRSCRDSGITWLALAGVDLARIQRRAGHDDVKTTLGYVKIAEDLTGKVGDPFGTLDAVVGQAAGQTRRRARQPSGKMAVKGWANGDLNPEPTD